MDFPDLRYFMVTWGVATEFGGMTAMCLARARTMREHAGIHAPILTFDFQPDYSEIRSYLSDQGRLAEGMEILNLYHYYRGLDLQDRPHVEHSHAPGSGVPQSDVQTQIVRDAEEHVFCRITRSLDAETVYRRDFQRPDGSTFLLDEASGVEGYGGNARVFSLLDTDGRVVGQWKSDGELYRAWMAELTGGMESVFIADSVQTLRFVPVPYVDNAMRFVVFHNSHIAEGGDPIRGRVTPARRQVVNDSSAWDGIIFLTERHRQDYIDRYGAAENLFCLTNPQTRAVSPADFDARKPSRGVMVCRLEAVKNVAAAIDVVNLARRTVPDIRLDIYGDGKMRRELQQQIDQQELGSHITLHGHTADAAAEFDTAAFSLLTSTMEGQPLALLESLGRGCPPVSFDIRYGPADVIDDGVNGYLVQSGDLRAAADRVARLCTDPGAARRLSDAAWDSAKSFSEDAVLEGLAGIVHTARNQRARRLRLRNLTFRQERFSVLATGEFEIDGILTFEQQSGLPAAEVLMVALQLVPRKSGPPLRFPGEVLSAGPGSLRVRLTAATADIAASVTSNEVLDAFLVVAGNNVLHRQRIAFGSGTDAWVPYATVNGQLSWKQAGPS